MHIITSEELPEFVESLKRHFPKSLMIYCLGRNRVRKQFDWPGTEIVVDQYPNYSVCVSRPIADSKDYVAYPSEGIDGIVIFATGVTAAEKFLRHPSLFNWKHRITFLAVAVELVPIIQEVAQQLGRLNGCTEDYRLYVLTSSKDILKDITPPKLPDGLHARSLDESHVEQITRNWNLAGRAVEEKIDYKESHQCIRYLLANKFPSMGLFNEADELISHVMYDFVGSLGKGFTRPDYRNRGIISYISYHLDKKVLEDVGQEFSWADIRTHNAASLKAAMKTAAVVPEWQVHYLYFTPKNSYE